MKQVLSLPFIGLVGVFGRGSSSHIDITLCDMEDKHRKYQPKLVACDRIHQFYGVHGFHLTVRYTIPQLIYFREPDTVSDFIFKNCFFYKQTVASRNVS